MGSDGAKAFNHPGNRPDQAEKRRQKSKCRQNAKETFELWNLQLPRFLHNLTQVRPRQVVPKNGGVNNASHRTWSASRLVQGLGEIAPLDQVRKTLQKFTHMNRGTMQVEEALGKNGDGDNAAGQNRPHQQPALLDVINHAGYLFTPFLREEQLPWHDPETPVSVRGRYAAWPGLRWAPDLRASRSVCQRGRPRNSRSVYRPNCTYRRSY